MPGVAAPVSAEYVIHGDDLGMFLDQSAEPMGDRRPRPGGDATKIAGCGGELSGRLAVDEFGALEVDWAVGD